VIAVESRWKHNGNKLEYDGNRWKQVKKLLETWLRDMNREEREEHVIQLYKQGKTIREIAELVHIC
jgi:DNA-binding NarL/FixJ family response regulator